MKVGSENAEFARLTGEDAVAFARRLESAGHAELSIRKALRQEFRMPVSEFGSFFEDFPTARARELERFLIGRSKAGRTKLVRSIARSFGISETRAADWLSLQNCPEMEGTGEPTIPD